jgi:hypothetical protein
MAAKGGKPGLQDAVFFILTSHVVNMTISVSIDPIFQAIEIMEKNFCRFCWIVDELIFVDIFTLSSECLRHVMTHFRDGAKEAGVIGFVMGG